MSQDTDTKQQDNQHPVLKIEFLDAVDVRILKNTARLEGLVIGVLITSLICYIRMGL